MGKKEISKIDKRIVFYISGYDPRGSSYYHRLYREESEKQCKINGSAIKVGRRLKDSKYADKWHIDFKNGKGETQTDYYFLKWDDVVRDSWIKHPLKLFVPAVRSYVHAFSSWNIKEVFRNSKGVFVTFLYPVLAIILVTALGWWLGSMAHGFLLEYSGGFFALAGAVAAFGAATVIGLKLAARINIYWLLRMYIFFSRHTKKGNEPFLKRLDIFADLIADKIRTEEADEYLIVGHSVGTMVSASVLARLLAKHKDLDISRMRLLTLGHCIPILSYLADAKFFHNDLITLAASPIDWLDFGAKGDGICFAMTDPFLNVCVNEKANVILLSPRFHKMFDVWKYRRIRLNKFLIHFQYLMAGDKLTDYDYFQITAGNIGLIERFKDAK